MENQKFYLISYGERVDNMEYSKRLMFPVQTSGTTIRIALVKNRAMQNTQNIFYAWFSFLANYVAYQVRDP